MKYNNDTLFKNYPELMGIKNIIFEVFEKIIKSLENGGTLFICGNGGSASDAEHIVGELLKEFMIKRPINNEMREKFVNAYGEIEGKYLSDKLQGRIRAISLNGHIAYTTAYINDVCAEMVYAQKLYVLGKKDDVILGISSSGNAMNVYNAFRIAKISGIKSILLTGQKEGICVKASDISIKVPAIETYRIQEYHLPVYHALCAMLEDYFYGNNR